jgi:pentose-5-phosphate-3-epimerase
VPGNFVSHKVYGPLLIKQLHEHTSARFDCTVRMPDAKEWISPLSGAGARSFSFSLKDVFDSDEKIMAETIFEMSHLIKESNMKTGVVLDDGDDVQILKPFLEANIMDSVMITSTPSDSSDPETGIMNAVDKIQWLR